MPNSKLRISHHASRITHYTLRINKRFSASLCIVHCALCINKRLAALLCIVHCALCIDISAQPVIFPAPHKAEYGQKVLKPTTITVLDAADKAARKYKKLLPAKAESYYLNVTPKAVVLVGTDANGLRYGQQTLDALTEGDSIWTATITDWPDIAHRGTVEGFYGEPWSHEARLRQIEFYGRHRLNTYIYGPKDDPYHSSPRWRDPYPADQAKKIHELVEASKQAGVNFVWAIHPGKDIQWNKTDSANVLNKFQMMYDLGVRNFAVFFDDISGAGTSPKGQAGLLNYIDNEFIKPKGDVGPLVMCPTDYNKSWGNYSEGHYMWTLGRMLNDGIEIMWTGDHVIDQVTNKTLDFINPIMNRKAYIWWNFPVSDYVRDHLLMGPVYGNDLDIQDKLSGFVSNPMEHADASMVTLGPIGDYCWNMAAYDSIASWRHTMQELMPTDWQALEVFCTHNSDLGPNGHAFRRDESWNVKDDFAQFITALASDEPGGQDKFIKNHKYIEALGKTLGDINSAANTLLGSKEAPYLIDDMRLWLQQFKLTGEYGLVVLSMSSFALMDFQRYADDYESLHKMALAIQAQMTWNDRHLNQNPYQPGVKTAGLVVKPGLDELFRIATELYNKKFGTTLTTEVVPAPFKLTTTVPQLAKQPSRAEGKRNRISPSLEVIDWPAGGSIVFTFEEPTAITWVDVDLGLSDYSQLQVVLDDEVIQMNDAGGTKVNRNVWGKKIKTATITLKSAAKVKLNDISVYAQ